MKDKWKLISNKWKLIYNITLIPPTTIGLLYIIIMPVIESGNFLVFISFIGVYAALFIGACLYVMWLENNDKRKMTQDAGLDNPPEPPIENEKGQRYDGQNR